MQGKKFDLTSDGNNVGKLEYNPLTGKYLLILQDAETIKRYNDVIKERESEKKQNKIRKQP